MTSGSKNLLLSALTNYIKIAFVFLRAIVLTRLLLLNLGENQYGLWILLWTVFGYALLLDFGFGSTVRKMTAGLKDEKDSPKLNRILSAVFISYWGIALVIAVMTAVAASYLGVWFDIAPEDLESSQNLFMLFGFGCALIFPTGIVSEILSGLQRIPFRNAVLILNMFLEISGIYIILHEGGGLRAIIIFTMLNNLFTNLLMFCGILKWMPGLRFSLRGGFFQALKSVLDFSLFTYLRTIAMIVLNRTDTVILGVMCGLPAVAVYQIGSRIPKIAEQLAAQMVEPLGPFIADLSRRNESNRLRELMFSQTQISAILGTGLAAILAPLIAPVLLVWLKCDDPTAIQIGYIMLASTFIFTLFRNASTDILLMAERHRLVAGIALFESIANLGLSIMLVYIIGISGVAWGTLIPNILIAFAVMVPVMFRFCERPCLKGFLKLYGPILASGSVPVLFLTISRLIIPLEEWTLLYLLFLSGIAGALYICGLYLWVLTDEQRNFMRQILSHRLKGDKE